MRAIYDAVRVFELIERLKFKENPDANVVEQSWFDSKQEQKLIEPLYHYDRYLYHWFTLIADPEVMMMPTTANIGFEDLLRLRSVQIGFVGVSTKTIRVDRHYQTPIDFWYHDVNHVRRMVGYLSLLMRQRKISTIKEKDQLYKELNEVIDKYIDHIILTKKPTGDDKIALAMWERETALKRILRVILFEMVHESALTPDRDTLFKELLRDHTVPQPFEYLSMVPGGVNGDKELIRMDNGSLFSGARRMGPLKEKYGGGPAHVIYINDRALSLLSNVKNKLIHGFYDSTYDPKGYVVPVEYRTTENIVLAAEMAFHVLGVAAPSHEELVTLVESREGSPEKYLKYKGILLPSTTKEISAEYLRKIELEALLRANLKTSEDHEDRAKVELIEQVLTEIDTNGEQLHSLPILEPMTKEEISNVIKSYGKKVWSKFGYSALGYEDEEKLKAKWKTELAELDPKEWIINIGVTKEGTGMLYKIAKEMGFQTTGFVSTKFLEKGGHYDENCDHIFIIKDDTWGGYKSDGTLSAITDLFVSLSDVISADGGGAITAITLKEMAKIGKQVKFTPFEMNHAAARAAAVKSGRPLPTTFKGEAELAWPKVKKILLSRKAKHQGAGLRCGKALNRK